MSATMAEKKHAAYICSGCELGARLDVATLVKTATKDGKMQLVREHAFLCSAEGVAMIQNDLDNEGVTHVAICACSRRAKTEAFNFPTTAISRGNLREGVIWVRPDTEEARETTQEMAEDYVRMACAEVKAMTVPSGNTNVGGSKTLLVVGGGISGMTSALEAAKAGYKVVQITRCPAPIMLKLTSSRVVAEITSTRSRSSLGSASSTAATLRNGRASGSAASTASEGMPAGRSGDDSTTTPAASTRSQTAPRATAPMGCRSTTRTTSV